MKKLNNKKGITIIILTMTIIMLALVAGVTMKITQSQLDVMKDVDDIQKKQEKRIQDKDAKMREIEKKEMPLEIDRKIDFD